MKYQVRNNVFETNSSSCHAIVLMERNDHYTPEEVKKECWIFDNKLNLYEHNMRFDKSPFEVLSKFHNKLTYCLAALGESVYDELNEIVGKYTGATLILPTELDYELKSYITEEQLIKKLEAYENRFSWLEELDYWTDEDGDYHYYAPYFGYAEDYGMLKGFLEERNISLEEFITNKKYVIIVDGDEYCIWDGMKKSGLINMDKIEEEVGGLQY